MNESLSTWMYFVFLSCSQLDPILPESYVAHLHPGLTVDKVDFHTQNMRRSSQILWRKE